MRTVEEIKKENADKLAALKKRHLEIKAELDKQTAELKKRQSEKLKKITAVEAKKIAAEKAKLRKADDHLTFMFGGFIRSYFSKKKFKQDFVEEMVNSFPNKNDKELLWASLVKYGYKRPSLIQPPQEKNEPPI